MPFKVGGSPEVDAWAADTRVEYLRQISRGVPGVRIVRARNTCL